MSEDEAIEIILDNKKEYEKIIKELEDITDANGNKPIETIQDCQKFVQAIETILDLYQEDEEIIKRLNAEYETAQGYIVVLKKSLKEEKEKNKEIEKENWIMRTVDKQYISKDKIKAILEEYRYTKIEDTEKIIEFYKKIQGLLEEN